MEENQISWPRGAARVCGAGAALGVPVSFSPGELGGQRVGLRRGKGVQGLRVLGESRRRLSRDRRRAPGCATLTGVQTATGMAMVTGMQIHANARRDCAVHGQANSCGYCNAHGCANVRRYCKAHRWANVQGNRNAHGHADVSGGIPPLPRTQALCLASPTRRHR